MVTLFGEKLLGENILARFAGFDARLPATMT
jgi:hypothetical protein